DRLVVDLRIADVRPSRLLERKPVPIRLEPPLGQEIGLALLGRDETNDALVEPRGHGVLLDVGDEAVPIAPFDEVVEVLRVRRHACSYPCVLNAPRSREARRSSPAAVAADYGAGGPRASPPGAPCGCSS